MTAFRKDSGPCPDTFWQLGVGPKIKKKEKIKQRTVFSKYSGPDPFLQLGVGPKTKNQNE